LLLTLAALIVSATAAQVTCPTLNPQPDGDFSIRSDGIIVLGFRTAVRDAVTTEEIIINDRSVITGIVWANQGVDVDYYVTIGTLQLDSSDRLINDYGFIYTPDASNVIFADTANPPAVVCEIGSVSSCSSPKVLSCDDQTGGQAQVGSTLQVDDLFVADRRDPLDPRIRLANVFDGSARTFRDVEIADYAIVRFDGAGLYAFRNLHIGSDVVIILNDEEFNDWQFFVNFAFDVDERVQIIRQRTDQALVVYQHSNTDGYVWIDNAPANRGHYLPISIVSRASDVNGGYVHIGLRQCIRGTIVAAGDVFISNDASVGVPCGQIDIDDIQLETEIEMYRTGQWNHVMPKN